MPDGNKLSEFVAWCGKNISGDEKGQAQIFLAPLLQAFGQPNYPDAKKLMTEDCIRPNA